MKKAPEAFRTISEVSALLDTPAHVLRFWESKFYQIKPIKRAGGRRYYRPDDVALLAGIRHLLVDEAQTIRGVQRLLQERGARHVTTIGAQTARFTLAATPVSARDLPQAIDTDPDGVAPAGTDDTDIMGDTPVTDAPPRVPPADAPAMTSPAAPPPNAASRPTPAGIAPTPPLAGPETSARIDPASQAQDPPPRAPDRIAPRLRALPRGPLGPRRDRLDLLARRIDALLDRMSEASGAGRW